jgi:hypothetical protein
MMCRTKLKLPHLEEAQMVDLLEVVRLFKSERATPPQIVMTFECSNVHLIQLVISGLE